MDVPIACTLDAVQAADQLDEWRGLLGAVVTIVERPGPGTLRALLQPGTTRLADVVALAQREKACCAFFEFSLEIEADAVALVVRVPDDAEPILDDFAAMLS